MLRHDDFPASLVPLTAGAARRALAFLPTGTDLHGSAPLALDALALAGLCSRIDPPSAAAARERAAPLLAGGGPNPAAGEVTTALLAIHAAVVLDLPLPASFRTYLQVLAELVPRKPVTANDAAVRLALDGEAGLAKALTPPASISPRALRRARGDELRTALGEIERDTGFGSSPPAADSAVTALLEGHAFQALRRYDLPLGLRCLRARLYVDGRPTHASRAAFDLLRLSQAEDGSFGDYDTPISRLAGEAAPLAAWRIKLPVALQTLWTMAEIELGARRLLPRLFGPLGLTDLFPREEVGDAVLVAD